MPRKPAKLEMIGGKGPRQRVWDLIRAQKGKPWERRHVTPGDIAEDTVRTYVRSLELAGFVVEVGRKESIAGQHARIKLYELVKDVGVEAPRLDKKGNPVTQGLATEQMWRVLRTNKGDTNARELAAYASTEEVPVSEVAAGDYLRNLHLAGYLLCTEEGRGPRRGQAAKQARYKLKTNTGPKPPMVCRTDAIYDPNLGETIWIRPVDEETAIYGT